MALIKPVKGIHPQFGNDCYLAENSTIVGDVIMGNQCSIWFNAVIRGDVNSIRMGNKVNVQDGAIIHCTYQKTKTIIGNNVSIGHNALVHGCTIHDNVLIGMGAIVMDNCEIESNTIIAFGGMVAEEIFFGESSTGVASDLQAATLNACQMVGILGMGSSLISVAAIESAGGGVVGKVLADEARRSEVEALLTSSKESVGQMLEEYRHVVEALRDALLLRSELIGEEILDVIRQAQVHPGSLSVDPLDGRRVTVGGPSASSSTPRISPVPHITQPPAGPPAS